MVPTGSDASSAHGSTDGLSGGDVSCEEIASSDVAS
jgi:hypothetical protein